MKNLILITFLLITFTAIGAETVDNAGYTGDNMSIERVTMDAEWDAAQAEFDKPNP